jgi:hypothetical protein
MAYSNLEPREQAYRIVSDLMRDSARYGPGIEPDMVMNVLEKLIKERDYWQRECEGARSIRGMARLGPMSNSYPTMTIDQSIPPGYELVWDAKQNVTTMRLKNALQPDKKPDKPGPPATPADPIRDRMSGLDFEDDK